MATELNKVEVGLSIAGQSYYIVELKLSQSFNAHHTFTAIVDYEEMDEKWMESPGKIIQLIGQDTQIEMKHRDGSGLNLFSGIVTNVSFIGRHGQQNYIQIIGCSPTIRLDGTKTMDSFMDKTLSSIVSEAVANSGNGGNVVPSPAFSGQIDYACQYEETVFEFLNRLSWIYGEWFFYDGTTCYFGKPGGGDSDIVTYDSEMTEFSFSANMRPVKMTRYHYLVHDDKEIQKNAPNQVPGIVGYHTVALGQSSSVYTSDVDLPVEGVVKNLKELEDLSKAEKTRMVGDMLVMSGKSQTSKIKIGKEVLFMLPKNMEVTKKEIGSFLITEVTHIYNQKGEYENVFTGIPSEMENIPMSPVAMPKAFPQIATINSNEDEQQLGRVKVEFQWQKTKNKTTNWIRVKTPDAGKSGVVPKNRGFVFIPEKDDIVMIDFEYGDPNRPYVSGSIFSEKVSIGGGVDNNIKTIITRSGHTLKFDDTKGKEKIQLYDIKGNIVEIDTVADTINISANSTINLTAVNINLMAKNAITETAGVTFIASAGATSTITGGVSTFINAGKEAAIKAGKTLSTNAGKDTLIATGMNSQMKLDNKGNASLKGKKKVDVSSKEKVYIAGDKQTSVISKDMKIQGKTKTSIKGNKVHVG